MAAIDAEYWDKCVSKVFKEIHQYMIYDGLITPPEDVVEDNLAPEASLPDILTEGDDDGVMPSTSSVVPPNNTTSSEDKNNDEFKNFIVKQCTEELISPSKLASMHNKSEKTIRKWVKSSGLPLPQKYQQKSQQKITFSSYKEDLSLSTANTATQSLTKELILNLKSKWPSLLKANKTSIPSYPGWTIYKLNKPYFLSEQSCKFFLIVLLV
jgi:transposase-like protein